MNVYQINSVKVIDQAGMMINDSEKYGERDDYLWLTEGSEAEGFEAEGLEAEGLEAEGSEADAEQENCESDNDDYDWEEDAEYYAQAEEEEELRQFERSCFLQSIRWSACERVVQGRLNPDPTDDYNFFLHYHGPGLEPDYWHEHEAEYYAQVEQEADYWKEENDV